MEFTSRFIRIPRQGRPVPYTEATKFIREHGEILPVDFSQSKTIRFPAPVPLFGSLPQPTEFTTQVGTYDRLLAKLTGVSVWRPEGFIVANREVLTETCWGSYNLEGNPVTTCGWQPWPKRLRGEWFSCGLYWSTYYYHWICDVLPRLHGVLENIPSTVKFIIHAPLREYETTTMAALGITPDRCYAHDGFRPLKPEVLYYATPVAMSGDHDPVAMRWVRQKILDYIFPQGVPTPPSPGLRIYISRSRAKLRRVVNEEVLLPILQHHGFMIVHAEDLSFAEQVALFSKACVMVGPHGGGMTNMVWAPESCSVFEIFEPAILRRHCYWSLAHTLHHRYFMSVGTACPNPSVESDIAVDPKQFELALESVLKA